MQKDATINIFLQMLILASAILTNASIQNFNTYL